jgi:hypothetical protein
VFSVKEEEEEEFQFITNFFCPMDLKTALRFLTGEIHIFKNFNYVIIIPVDFHEKI